MGREILRALSTDESVAAVHSVGRRAMTGQAAKVASQVVDFSSPFELPHADACFIALGTTIKVAGSQAAQYAVDHDAVIAVARAAKAAGCERCGVVSAMGADPRSRIFYNRVKGEMERDLRAVGFSRLVIARPSFLVGDRESLGQPVRAGEGWANSISQWLRPLIPANLRSIEASKVAAVLLREVMRGDGVEVILSGDMQS